MVINAMKEFEEGFNLIESEVKYSEEEFNQIKKRGDEYITTEYLPRLNKNIVTKANLEEE